MFDSLPTGITELCESIYPNIRFSGTILRREMYKEKPVCLQQWLHPDELRQLDGYRFEKRQREWLSGRLCSKEALHTFLLNHPPAVSVPNHYQIKVCSKKSGQPYFDTCSSLQSPAPELSISHSHDHAAALVATGVCGIDIQFSTDKLIRVADHFCSQKEEQLLATSLADLGELSRLTLLWTGKEALKKMLSPQGIPGFMALQLQSISHEEQKVWNFVFSRSSDPARLLQVPVTLYQDIYGLAVSCDCGETTRSNKPFAQEKHHAGTPGS